MFWLKYFIFKITYFLHIFAVYIKCSTVSILILIIKVTSKSTNQRKGTKKWKQEWKRKRDRMRYCGRENRRRKEKKEERRSEEVIKIKIYKGILVYLNDSFNFQARQFIRNFIKGSNDAMYCIVIPAIVPSLI